MALATGLFQAELENNEKLENRFEELISYFMNTLTMNNCSFTR